MKFQWNLWTDVFVFFSVYIRLCWFGFFCFNPFFLINSHPKFYSIVIFILRLFFFSFHMRASYLFTLHLLSIYASMHQYIICRHSFEQCIRGRIIEFARSTHAQTHTYTKIHTQCGFGRTRVLVPLIFQRSSIGFQNNCISFIEIHRNFINVQNVHIFWQTHEIQSWINLIDTECVCVCVFYANSRIMQIVKTISTLIGYIVKLNWFVIIGVK